MMLKKLKGVWPFILIKNKIDKNKLKSIIFRNKTDKKVRRFIISLFKYRNKKI